jgi:transposase-like protein
MSQYINTKKSLRGQQGVNMAQQILPLFFEGENSINDRVHYEYNKDTGNVNYFLHCLPCYFHNIDDTNNFKLVIAQLVKNGHCRKCEIITKFEVTKSYVDRAVGLLEREGIAGFFKKRNTRSAPVLTDNILIEAQHLLASGETRSEVANTLGVKLNTLGKAITAGRLIEKKEST